MSRPFQPNPVSRVTGSPRDIAAAAAARAPWAPAPAPDEWLPAVSNVSVASPNLGTFVLYKGGPNGWKYTGMGMPQMVSVIGTQSGGPTGLLVHIAAAPLIATPNEGAPGFRPIYDPAVVYGVGNPELTAEVSTPGECCFDTTMSILVCNAGDPRDGKSAKFVSSVAGPNGPLVVVSLDDGTQLTVSACAHPPETCCYDVATGTLRCPKNEGLNGQQVSLLAMTQQVDGSILSIVQIQGQSGVATFPICNDQVSECCYDGAAQQLRCSDASLNGTDAAIVASWTNKDGAVWVWAVWPGGGARMPLCPGTKDCPPVFCCVNVETMKFVCPGRSDVNGRTANVTNIVTDQGFNWGILGDGSRVALCGRECPPPEMCPGCSTCPPGLWMSPDGTCTPPPKCPECPDYPPGRTQPCAPYPGTARSAPYGRRAKPNPTPCCDDCAHGKPCSGCKEPNPRRRRIFSGMRRRNA
jgi:hypothetical protein